VAGPIRLALVWHMHQPDYRDPATGRFVLPWTRLHATKDYGDMVAALAPHPRARVTFSLTPILLDQLDALASTDYGDPHLRVARLSALSLEEADRAFLLREFFHVHRERMLEPHARYRELARRAEEERQGGARLTVEEVRDLQTWFHLAWIDPTYRAEEPFRALMEKGARFTEEEKHAVLEGGIALARRILPAYRAAEERGQAELATVPYHHPILPLLIDTNAPRAASAEIALPEPSSRALEDARDQVRAARRAHETRFGRAPAGVWPAEGAVDRASLELLAAEGFRWAASDEETLRRALEAAGDPRAGDPSARLQAWNVETAAGTLALLFRDRALSDAIGFRYQFEEARHAAADFVAGVRSAAAAWNGRGAPIVTVILDGENCWESYPDDGGPFLHELYAALDGAEEIEMVTVSEALRGAPARETLRHVPVGSWIRPDLGIWVGHAEKNRAWEELGAAREAIRAAGDAAKRRRATASLHAAEASDWFWWYGDDHPTAHAVEFDRLFRAHVSGVYRALGLPPPSRLGQSLRAARDVAAAEAESAPTEDPWERAMSVDPSGAAGAMHETTGALVSIRYRADDRALYLRVETRPGAALGGAELVVERLAGQPGETPAARVPLAPGGEGVPAWTGAESGDEQDEGSVQAGPPLELRLPFARFGVSRGRALDWRLKVEREAKVEALVPRAGAFRTVREL
jgi:alpha-amylase/alpha-mannosidase (GH57 family)